MKDSKRFKNIQTDSAKASYELIGKEYFASEEPLDLVVESCKRLVLKKLMALPPPTFPFRKESNNKKMPALLGCLKMT